MHERSSSEKKNNSLFSVTSSKDKNKLHIMRKNVYNFPIMKLRPRGYSQLIIDANTAKCKHRS